MMCFFSLIWYNTYNEYFHLNFGTMKEDSNIYLLHVLPSISDEQNLFYTDFNAMLLFHAYIYVVGMEIIALV